MQPLQVVVRAEEAHQQRARGQLAAAAAAPGRPGRPGLARLAGPARPSGIDLPLRPRRRRAGRAASVAAGERGRDHAIVHAGGALLDHEGHAADVDALRLGRRAEETVRQG